MQEFRNIIQTIDDEEYIEEEMEEVLSKKVQSQQYKNLLSALNFSFDDLSKTSKETIQTISQICAELKIREPSEDFILTELIALENEEDELQSTLQDLQEKNKFYKQVEENISSLLESSNSHLEHLEQRIKESEENARTIEDRVNDILEPKSAEYSAQIKQIDVERLFC